VEVICLLLFLGGLGGGAGLLTGFTAEEGAVCSQGPSGV